MMKRKLAKILAVAMVAMLPVAANALGFGTIKLQSALNEPLDAQIDLLSPTEDDLSNLKIKLASQDAYLRLGIDRSALLSELKFAVKERDDGTHYVHVTTRVPVREPFLNFLLEMDWQNGRMLREYTMLLDPPGMVKKQPAVVEAPVTTAPEVVAEQEAATPVPAPFMPEPVPAPMVAEPEPAPAPFTEPEPMVTAAPVAEAPTEAEEKYPLVPITETQEAEPETLAMPAPEPVIETEQVATPASEPMLEPIPEPQVAPVQEESVAALDMPAPAVVDLSLDEPVEPAAATTFEDDSELFPSIPLTAYGETEVAEAPVFVEGEPVEMAGGELGELDYGIVKEGDNLWTISEKLRAGDPDVSVYQIMMALLRSNPDAFVDGNVNRLKVGHVLRIDDPGMLTSISKAEAAAEYQSQTAAWDEYRETVAATTTTQPIIGSEVDMGDTASIENGGELTLGSPDGEELQGGAGTSEEVISNDIVTLQDELRQVRTDSVTMRSHNQELNEKLRELETELAQMQRSISVKDDELAALQQQLADLRATAADTSATEAIEETVTPIEEELVTEPEPVMAEPEPTMVEEVTTAEMAEPIEQAEMAEPEMAEAEMAEAEMAEAETEPVSPVQLAEEIASQEQAQQPKPSPVGEKGFMDAAMGALGSIGTTLTNLLGGSLLFIIAIPVVLVLVILMLIVVRRRKKAGESYQESILTGGPASVTGAAEATSVESEEESSFLSDFAVSGAGAIQTEDSEVDPLTEADVFMAYGRYEAAEERLKEAIESEPGRAELKLKLIELFYSTKNKPAFENAAEDFYASVGENASENSNWQKVAAMGAELVPSNPIFSGANAADAPAAVADLNEDSSVSLSDSQVMDIGLDTGVFNTDDFASSEPAASESSPAEFDVADVDIDSGVMEFNMDESADLAETASADEPEVDFNLDTANDLEQSDQSDLSDLEFNLDLGETDFESEAQPQTAELAEESGLDFNLDMGEATEAISEPVQEASDGSGSLDFDLDLGESAEPAESDTSMLMDTSDVDLSVPAITDTDPTLDFEVDGTDAGDMDIGGGDEVGTKLDLAKAYIDMGDPDGAKSILDEVMDEGNDGQKQEARDLLQQIA